MGELKESEYNRIQNGGFCKAFIWILSTLTVVFALVAVNYFQFNEILNLKQIVREQTTEIVALDIRLKNIESGSELSNRRLKRDVPTDSLSGLVTSLVQQEVKVLENFCGNASKICLPGPKGDAGVKGNQGIKGASGSSGPPGPKGHQGQYGVPGIPGLKGEQGGKGDTGDKGDTGARGPKGDYGLPGVPGPKGAMGQYGVPGIPGMKGDAGDEGVPGLKGEKGEEGVPLPFDQQCCSTLAKPHITGNQTEVIYSYAGQNVLLPCASSGYPPPTITFTPSLDPLNKNRYLKTPTGLEIQNVEFTDSGKYTCTVDNIFGTSTKEIELKITDPVVATTSPGTVNVNVGDNFKIDCVVSGNPPPIITWELRRPDGTTAAVTGIQSGIKTNSIAIVNANMLDAGSYTCHAQNPYEKDEATTVVTVTGKPQITNPPKNQFVLEGSSVTLTCGVASNPPAKITWTFPLTGSRPPLNAYITPDNSVTLTGVDGANSGTYTCTATNAQGTTTAQGTLSVEKGVTVNTSPHMHPITGNEAVLNFQCSSSGVPAPTVSWTKDSLGSLVGNSKFLVLSGGNLIITGVDEKTDTGVYSCTGQNSHGNATDIVIAYKEAGALGCTTTFSDITCGSDMVCGGTCPPSCPADTSQLYGYITYPGESPICTAAKHTGSIPNASNIAVWKHSSIPGTYASVTENGLTSKTHTGTSDSYMVLKPKNVDRPQTSGPTIG